MADWITPTSTLAAVVIGWILALFSVNRYQKKKDEKEIKEKIIDIHYNCYLKWLDVSRMGLSFSYSIEKIPKIMRDSTTFLGDGSVTSEKKKKTEEGFKETLKVFPELQEKVEKTLFETHEFLGLWDLLLERILLYLELDEQNKKILHEIEEDFVSFKILVHGISTATKSFREQTIGEEVLSEENKEQLESAIILAQGVIEASVIFLKEVEVGLKVENEKWKNLLKLVPIIRNSEMK